MGRQAEWLQLTVNWRAPIELESFQVRAFVTKGNLGHIVSEKCWNCSKSMARSPMTSETGASLLVTASEALNYAAFERAQGNL